ncbi:MAG: hypothetical protein CL609_23660 [Anaerolineaceae bacterium]|nr:hypothetical protein [Anaerolineaceae bacterium]
MSHKPRPWPNVAKEARDRAAEEAMVVLTNLKPLLSGTTVTETERIRRLALAMDAAQTCLRHLESVGAQTRPR